MCSGYHGLSRSKSVGRRIQGGAIPAGPRLIQSPLVYKGLHVPTRSDCRPAVNGLCSKLHSFSEVFHDV
jgi:hypothetical protein